MPSHHDVRLDVCMDNFWVRPTGVYGKPVWLRPHVLQLFYDDDNDQLRTHRGPTVPGGHAAFTRTCAVYSPSELDETHTSTACTPRVEALRAQVAAFTQRVGSCYIVEAGILGFANGACVSTGLSEQRVLSSACVWAVEDYEARHGEPPQQIVLHLDVNGSLTLGDVAGKKQVHKMIVSLSEQLLRRAEAGDVQLPESTRAAVAEALHLDEAMLLQEFDLMYNSRDLIRAVEFCRSILVKTRSAPLTLAIRTNGVEFEAAAQYIKKVLAEHMQVFLSEEADTLTRYVVTHEDAERDLYFHPVLLEKMAKTASYDLQSYVDELRTVCGRQSSLEAWHAVSAGSLKKADKLFKQYLGVSASEEEKPSDFSSRPPALRPSVVREAWQLPGDEDGDYKLLAPIDFRAAGPWWAGFELPVSFTAQTSASWGSLVRFQFLRAWESVVLRWANYFYSLLRRIGLMIMKMCGLLKDSGRV